MGPLLASQKL